MLWTFLIGVITGATVGVFVMCLMVTAKRINNGKTACGFCPDMCSRKEEYGNWGRTPGKDCTNCVVQEFTDFIE